jgi:hypothetical protein
MPSNTTDSPVTYNLFGKGSNAASVPIYKANVVTPPKPTKMVDSPASIGKK